MDEILENLNPQQKEAVESIDGPNIIIAGAGTGKTRVITHKIAYLINKGVNPENILALTFTDKAAEEMNLRVNELLNIYEEPNIMTFHSFCKELISENILDLEMNSDFKIIDDVSQTIWLVKNMNEFDLKHIRVGYYPKTLADELKKVISKMKDEGIDYDRLKKYIENQDKKELSSEEKEELNILKDILKVYKAYEDYKTKNGFIDFGDMLLVIKNMLSSNKRILEKYQEKFKYILVDEFQDTNYIQLQILKLLADKHKNITIVGDDDQSIYRFRGAYLTNILEFKEIYPNYKEIYLEQNYRNTQHILNVANKLMSNKPNGITKKLFTEKGDGDKVVVAECRNDEEQSTYILKEIKELLKDYEYKDIAILVRRKNDANSLISLFNKHNIPFEFVGNSEFFKEPIVKDVLSYIRIAHNPLESNAEIIRLLHRDVFSINPTEIARFSRYASHNKMSVFEAFEKIEDINVEKDKFEYFYETLQEVISLKNKLKLIDFVYHILFKLDFYKYEIVIGNEKNISLLNQFYKFISDYYELYGNDSLEDFIDYLEFASEIEINDEYESKNNVIQIMSIHAAKGKEFPVVFIPDVVNGRMPTRNSKDKFRIPSELINGIQLDEDEKELHIQEERRLFYVAITRAREKLFISYAKRYGDNKTDSKVSPYLIEIDYKNNPNVEFNIVDIDPLEIKEESVREQVRQKYIKEIVSGLNKKEYNDVLKHILLLAKIDGKNISELKNIEEPDYDRVLSEINETVENKLIEEPITFSVSQFNTYERCPRVYKYKYVYKIPSLPKPYFEFGGVIHSVIEELTKMMKNKENVDYETSLKVLEKHWKKDAYFSENEEEKMKEEAREILNVFLEEQEKINSEIVGIEQKFVIDLDGYHIKGYIDRIDKDGEDYIIIDYKTSKSPISKNKLKEDFQLLTYDLAVKSLLGKKPKKIGLWFLRLNKKVFVEATDEDIEFIKNKILETIKNILEENFEPKPGWECRNCDYRLICDASKY